MGKTLHAPRHRQGAGAITLILIALLLVGAFAGLILAIMAHPGNVAGAFDTYLLATARFTLWQALLSTIASVVPGFAVAIALFRLPALVGRKLVLGLFALPLAVPAIIAALGTLALYGRSGILAPALETITQDRWSGVFGMPGILLAHAFFNMPLAARLLLEALETIPRDRWRLASQLAMGSASRFRFIEWPALKAALPGVTGLVFMLCATSFAIVLTLGGGPRASTLEVAIYQALRFDFDPARAVALTAAQLLLTGTLVSIFLKMGIPLAGETNLSLSRKQKYFSLSVPEKSLALLIVMVAVLFVAAPLASILIRGLAADLLKLIGEKDLHRAIITSIVLGLFAASLSLMMTFGLLRMRYFRENMRRSNKTGWIEWLAGNGSAMILLIPPIVIGAGWFTLAIETGRGASSSLLGPALVMIVNAVMAMPFLMRLLRPAHDSAMQEHDRLATNLGISGWSRLRLVDWPVLRRPLAAGFAFAMALSLGDLGVITLFGSGDFQTLPWLLMARMGSYRTTDAAGIALILTALCLTLMMFAERTGRTGK